MWLAFCIIVIHLLSRAVAVSFRIPSAVFVNLLDEHQGFRKPSPITSVRRTQATSLVGIDIHNLCLEYLLDSRFCHGFSPTVSPSVKS
jgi:hypothetical protein